MKKTHKIKICKYEQIKKLIWCMSNNKLSRHYNSHSKMVGRFNNPFRPFDPNIWVYATHKGNLIFKVGNLLFIINTF